MYGCMNWTWFLDVDIQLYLLVPIHVIAYKRSKLLSVIILSLLIALNIGLNFYLTSVNEFKANIMTIGNAEVYPVLITKPYYRLVPHSLGVILAFIYRDILDFRKINYD